MSYLDGDEYLHGPSLAEWIDRIVRPPEPVNPFYVPAEGATNAPRRRTVSSNLTRLLHRARRGDTIRLDTLEPYLIHELDVTAHDVPDECWLDRRPRHPGLIKPGEKRRPR